jgi:transcriptional regulator with XRE-family HTH domain
MNDEYIGTCVRMAMAKNRVSNWNLARLMGVSVVTVANWRKGKIRDIETLTFIAEFCGLTREEMLDLADDKNKQQRCASFKESKLDE